MLAEALPILKWGWLGYNIIFGPLFISENRNGNQVGMIGWIGMTIIFSITVLVFVIWNYWEEENFRESYRLVALWALLHLVMGIPLWAVIPIFFSGVLYKHIYDKYSVDHAFTAHFATNTSLIFTLMLLLACEFLL